MKKLYLLLLLFTSFIYAQDPFITTWQVQGSDLSIYVPVTGSDYTIDFGDGIVLTNQTSVSYHTYATEGTYTITISGDYNQIQFSSGDNATKLKTIEQWGSAHWTNMQHAFHGCSNLITNATDAPDLSLVTDTSFMFYGCISLNQPLNSWDVSNVTNMKMMFANAGTFNQPLDDWDVSNVTNMKEMFRNAHSFNQPIGNWNVSNVSDFSGMFEMASSFDQLLNNWDVSSATTTSGMFRMASVFNQPLNNWNVSNVTDMSNMFREATFFNQPLNNWNVSNVENMEFLFHFSAYNHPLDNWDVSQVTNMAAMLSHLEFFNQPLENWNVSNVTNMSSMFTNSYSFNQPLNDWDVSNVEYMVNMFYLTTSFNQPLNNWDVSNVLNMAGMFYNAVDFDQDLSDWNFNSEVNLNYISSGFLTSSGLSTSNYDALLYKFVQLGLQDKDLQAQNVKYCATTVRNFLINNLGWNVTGDSLGDECEGNDISGTVLLDEDANGCDTNDVAATNFLVNAGDGSFNYSTFPSADGAYTLNVQDETYTMSLLNVPSYYTVNPTTAPVTFTGFGNSENLNFCLTANQAIQDLSITVLPLNEARPGFENNYQLVVKNMGTQTVASASVSLTFDNALQTFVTATPAPASTTASQLTFTVTDLQPFESSVIDLTMQTFTPPTVNGGEMAAFMAIVTPNANDFTPADNTFELAQEVVNSYDPNDKRVLQGETIFIEQADKYLDYIIRFQNTGSASAITVRIEDELHDKLDWTTLMPVSASYNYRVEITDGNHVEFIFDNINLPHQAADDAGSNGFVAYKIKPVANAEIGDIISGNASIFFDYNLPIITNTVTTEIIEELSVGDNYFNNQVTVYPNPAKNVLHLVQAESVQLEEVKIINLQGRELINIKAGFEAINVESLNQGVYLLVIKTSNGSLQQKLVKN